MSGCRLPSPRANRILPTHRNAAATPACILPARVGGESAGDRETVNPSLEKLCKLEAIPMRQRVVCSSFLVRVGKTRSLRCSVWMVRSRMSQVSNSEERSERPSCAHGGFGSLSERCAERT